MQAVLGIVIAIVMLGGLIYGIPRNRYWPGWSILAAFFAGAAFDHYLSKFQYPLKWEPSDWWSVGSVALGVGVASVLIYYSKTQKRKGFNSAFRP